MVRIRIFFLCQSSFTTNCFSFANVFCLFYCSHIFLVQFYAATLRAGVPTIVTPIFGDQYDNSHVVQNLGVGVGFELQLQKITANDLSDAINAVLNDSSMATRAKEVGEQVRKECGCRAIVEEVEKFWKENVRTGSFSKEINNWKSATQKMKSANKKKTQRNRIVLGSALAVAIIAFLIKYI